MTTIQFMMRRHADPVDVGHRHMVVSAGGSYAPKVHLTLAKTFMIGSKYKLRSWFGDHADLGMKLANQFRVLIR